MERLDTLTSPEKTMPSEAGRVDQSEGKGGVAKRICIRKFVLRMEMGGGRKGRIRININRRARARVRGQVTGAVSFLQSLTEWNRFLYCLLLWRCDCLVDVFVGEHGLGLVAVGAAEEIFCSSCYNTLPSIGSVPSHCWGEILTNY